MTNHNSGAKGTSKTQVNLTSCEIPSTAPNVASRAKVGRSDARHRVNSVATKQVDAARSVVTMAALAIIVGSVVHRAVPRRAASGPAAIQSHRASSIAPSSDTRTTMHRPAKYSDCALAPLDV